MWATIHLLYLVGFRSRIAVLFTWLYSYVTWRRVARLITFTPWLRRRELEARPPGHRAGPVPAGSAPPVPLHAARER